MTLPPHGSFFTIELSRGKQAVVDELDWCIIRRYNWHAFSCSTPVGSFYAGRAVYSGGSKRVVCMHRQIMGLNQGDPRHVDHENHNTLDNRKQNLRIVTNRKNSENRLTNSPHGAGVYHEPQCALPFRARARFGKKLYTLGRFKTADEARRHRDLCVREYEHNLEMARRRKALKA